MIRLQFSTTPAWQSGAIRHILHSVFSHVDALDEDGNCIGASDSQDAPYIAGNPRGVAVRPPQYQTFLRRRVAILNAPPEVEAAFYVAIRSQLGKPFDNGALYAFLGDNPMGERNWREESSWFCSELVTWSLDKAAFWKYPLVVAKDRVSPADLLLLLNPYLANVETFWDVVPGLTLGANEV